MRKFLTILTVALSLSAMLPIVAHATSPTGDTDPAYQTSAGAGAR